ncbi:MAG: 2-C-methyl-D-erythritol 4-phosphate cytidylyltransferase [Chitinophagaceae bacterium]|nr:2-C-methyl-D-erythritol 4-phosphate cytidylyltransferase [Chitinophagaceae bacterium]
MYKYVIIVAGGSGLRMGNDIPKQFLLLQGRPVLWHSIKAFTEAYSDLEMILVLPPNHLEAGENLVKDFPTHKINITTGGETRFHSVKNGLKFVKEPSVVFVHDGVRCLVTTKLIRQCYEATIEKGNAVPAITATDTIRIATGSGNEQIDRNKVFIIQTPQTFLSEMLIKGFKQDYTSLFTDEGSVVENTGIKINIISGEETNIKITRPMDLVIAEKILQERET